MMPSYIDDLQLSSVFAAYTTRVDRYLQQSTEDEHIVDSEKHKISGFVTSTFGQDELAAGKSFSVLNPSNNPYVLLQIDKGIIKSPTIKKCDCAIANDASLCFIEFKANATSRRLSTIHHNYTEAMEQLSSTIGIFDSYYIPLGSDFRAMRNVEAYICFRHGYPRKTSTQMHYQVLFATQNKGIPLSFEREKIL